MMLLIHPDAEVAWSLDSVSGRVTTTYVADSLIAYDLALIPGSDYVDLDMTIRILTDAAWTDVFAFNCISPARADPFRDSALERTYISVDGRPRAVGGIAKTAGPRPRAYPSIRRTLTGTSRRLRRHSRRSARRVRMRPGSWSHRRMANRTWRRRRATRRSCSTTRGSDASTPRRHSATSRRVVTLRHARACTSRRADWGISWSGCLLHATADFACAGWWRVYGDLLEVNDERLGGYADSGRHPQPGE